MKTNIKATSIEMTPAIADYIKSKISYLDRLTSGYDDASAEVEVGKTTNRRKNGEVMFAAINIKIAGKLFRQVVNDEDLYAAIDRSKDKIEMDIASHLKKKNRLLRRGARTLKDLAKGFRPERKEKGLPK